MRRQARISAGGALVVRSASALQVWLWLLIFVFQNEFRISRSIQPGVVELVHCARAGNTAALTIRSEYLDFDNLPETNFTCTGKVIGGYYADLETSCQMFHVCTVGQQDEPMDIKFLCLNGTVFDQETRVCERVDEVDCTKSEKFYSLNLELYGSTVPPIIQPDEEKPQTQSTEQPQQLTKSTEKITDPFVNESPTAADKIQNQSPDTIDSTEDPVQEIKKEEPKYPQDIQPIHPSLPPKEHVDIVEEYQDEGDEIDSENTDYEEDYSHHLITTTVQAPITMISTTTKQPSTTTISSPTSNSPPVSHLVSSPIPAISSFSPQIHSSLTPSVSPAPTIDPSLLSPQEFIYRHRGPGSEAISFQRQSFRPADGVFITHAPPQQFDHFQYESSRTAPRPVASRPAPFVQRPQPAPFRPTTLDPRNQILRPGPTSQPSDKHELSTKNRQQQPYPSSLPSQHPLPYNPFYYDRKRSDDSIPEVESSVAARSVAPPTIRERPPNKPKSPPRVIVTASASVSDSNGKRLNYTVGNVVSAVKPIVPINYDDYKESDLIFDPFFLDVPKLKQHRKTRSSKNRKVFTVPVTSTISEKELPTTFSPITSRATTIKTLSTTASTSTTAATWNPDDYVDDNYEPHAYMPPVPPLAILVTDDKKTGQHRKHETLPLTNLAEQKINYDNKIKVSRVVKSRPTSSSATQTISSQSAGTEAASSVSSPSPLEVPACASSRYTDCRLRA